MEGGVIETPEGDGVKVGKALLEAQKRNVPKTTIVLCWAVNPVEPYPATLIKGTNTYTCSGCGSTFESQFANLFVSGEGHTIADQDSVREMLVELVSIIDGQDSNNSAIWQFGFTPGQAAAFVDLTRKAIEGAIQRGEES